MATGSGRRGRMHQGGGGQAPAGGAPPAAFGLYKSPSSNGGCVGPSRVANPVGLECSSGWSRPAPPCWRGGVAVGAVGQLAKWRVAKRGAEVAPVVDQSLGVLFSRGGAPPDRGSGLIVPSGQGWWLQPGAARHSG